MVRSPAALDEMVSLATHTVFAEVIDAAEPETLRKIRTFDAVVLASLATTEMLSTTAPSLAKQSTRRTQPPPLGVLILCMPWRHCRDKQFYRISTLDIMVDRVTPARCKE